VTFAGAGADEEVLGADAVFGWVEPAASAANAPPRATIAATETCVAWRSLRAAPSRARAARRGPSSCCAMAAGSQRQMRPK
jgi:hypothetical protein